MPNEPLLTALLPRRIDGLLASELCLLVSLDSANDLAKALARGDESSWSSCSSRPNVSGFSFKMLGWAAASECLWDGGCSWSGSRL